jgi:acyl carrier protein
MVPAAFVSLQAFPLTPNRKIDRKSLPAPDQSRPALETAFVAPRTRGEATLAAFFQEVLGLEEVGVLDRFTDLGGDSLSAVELLVRIEQAFEVELPLSTFFKAPSIAALGEEIERARATPRSRGAERVSTA